MALLAPTVDPGYLAQIDGARRELRSLLAEKNCSPIMLRLAFHDAGTYDVRTLSGGANGSIRSEKEYSHGGNTGMKIAMDILEPVKAKFPRITYADLYQDSLATTPDGRLPDASKGSCHLRDIFHRMGFSDQEIVALSGSHTLGRAHKERSGFEGSWTSNPLKFDNSYFKEVLKGGSEGLLTLPTDKCLVEDAGFRPWVESYAKSEEQFFRDYASAHKKMSELGCKDTSPAFWGGAKGGAEGGDVSASTLFGQSAVGFAATAVVLIFAYVYEARRKVM